MYCYYLVATSVGQNLKLRHAREALLIQLEGFQQSGAVVEVNAGAARSSDLFAVLCERVLLLPHQLPRPIILDTLSKLYTDS